MVPGLLNAGKFSGVLSVLMDVTVSPFTACVGSISAKVV